MTDTTSSSAFIEPGSFSRQWSDITLLQTRSRNIICTGARYGRRFLLKALRPEHRSLTEYMLLHEKEFRLGMSVSHPAIAATYSYEEIPELGICIVQEYIDGLPLAEWLAGNPSTAARHRVLEQLLDALDYLHGRQLVHHDLKSGNILITSNGQNVKLIDFGLSDTDDSLTPRRNDPREDIRRLAPLLQLFFPHRYALVRHRCAAGHYPNIAALHRAIQTRQHLLRWLPIALSVLMLMVSFLMLTRMQRQVEETQAALDYSIDTAEIRAVLDSIYRPVYDSLRLPDARYREIASGYLASIPNPMPVYQRMAARYPLGSAQYVAFSETWQGVNSQIYHDIYWRLDSMPSIGGDYRAGILSEEEYIRLVNHINGIASRHL